MQAGDLGDLPNAAVTAASRFASRDPAALLLIHTAENQIEVLMILPLGMFTLLARSAPAFPLRTSPFHAHLLLE
jgi:hypothetical protein